MAPRQFATQRVANPIIGVSEVKLTEIGYANSKLTMLNLIPRKFYKPFRIGTSNCGQCSLLGDKILGGEKVANIWLPTKKYGNPGTLLNNMKHIDFYQNINSTTVFDILNYDGARGILLFKNPRLKEGHMFNMININGNLHIYDFQTGKQYGQIGDMLNQLDLNNRLDLIQSQ